MWGIDSVDIGVVVIVWAVGFWSAVGMQRMDVKAGRDVTAGQPKWRSSLLRLLRVHERAQWQ